MALTTERQKIAHLLRRFGFGASEAELEFYAARGLKATINHLLDPGRPDGINFTPQDFVPENNNLNLRTAQTWWMSRLLVTQHPLREKLALFWHDHFATSAEKVTQVRMMVRHVNMLRTHGLGRFQDLLLEVSRDPAMIFWLDNQLNVRGKPNENFAREIMELFTLGIGHYSEKDVQEVARAFTGWGIGRGNRRSGNAGETLFVFNANQHDTGTKTILGNTGPFGGEEVVGILVGHPQTARHLVTKLWEFFVYEKPEPALIDRLSAQFRANGLHIGHLLRLIMESEEFYSTRAERKLYKNPIDFCVATLRQLGLGAALQQGLRGESRNRAVQPAVAAMRSTKAMGMELMLPPDVAGWDWGSAWISTATMVERMKWAERLFGTGSPGNLSLRVPIGGLMQAGDTPAVFTRRMLSLFDVALPAAKEAALVRAAEDAAGGDLRRNVQRTALAVTRLIFSSPEFQFA